MKTVITLSTKNKREIPSRFKDNDNRFSESFVEYFLEKFTDKGDKILDIFAGLGTTLFVAEEMDRVPFGIEYDKERYEYIKQHLKNKNNIFHGDSLKLDELEIPKCDFCITSPPYMNHYDKENPFTGCETESNYDQYLKDIQTIFSKVKQVMKDDAIVLVEVSNLKNNDILTTLAWDIAKTIAEVLTFEGELIISWSSEQPNDDGIYGYGYDHSYCLIFTNKN